MQRRVDSDTSNMLVEAAEDDSDTGAGDGSTNAKTQLRG
jgi:hypothetical protein